MTSKVERDLVCGNEQHCLRGNPEPCFCKLKKGHEGKHSCYCGEKWK